MTNVIEEINKRYFKTAVVKVRSGDTVRVHQRIKEGNKERVQVFQGLVIKTSNQKGHLSRITVRRIASGIGVEKSFLIHSPLVEKVEVTKRSKVRRNYLSYMRQRTGKSARLSSINFDKSINEIPTSQSQESVANDKAQSDSANKDDQSTDQTKISDKNLKTKEDQVLEATKDKDS